MEFGKVPQIDLYNIDFTLPVDTELNLKTLADNKRTNSLQVFVGSAKWGRKEWINKIYPPKTKEVNFLDEYVKHFNSIELNATFYKIYDPEAIHSWKEKAVSNPDFRFCPKFSQTITHYRRFKNVDEVTTAYYNSILAFGDHLGPLFIQVGNNFTPKSFPALKAYLESLPTDIPVFLELRHKEWFANSLIRKELLDLLTKLKIGAVLTDTAGRRDVLHMELTTAEAFVRFVGNNLHPTDYIRMDDWVSRIKSWQAQGLQKLWFFMHQPDEVYTPEAADYFIEKLNAELGLNLMRPIFLNKNQI